MPNYHEFPEWRDRARELLRGEVPPSPGLWRENDVIRPLFSAGVPADLTFGGPPPNLVLKVSKTFLRLAERVCVYRGDEALHLLYKISWRLVHGEKRLLENPLDADVIALTRMERAVRRDIHKMHAFVRFQKVEDDYGELFTAWHRPDHYILTLAAPFFVRRFGNMRWHIGTPDGSVIWDLKKLSFGPGISIAPQGNDPLEGEWKAYYQSIFNPARLKLNAMKKEMPVRHWPTLPEAALIPGMIAQAGARTEGMRAAEVEQAVPTQTESLALLREEAKSCSACSLCKSATQTVFGQGPTDARIVFVGEQPGDEEDLTGTPFIGPAGKLLDQAIAAAQLNRGAIYVTNAVKHFKWEPRGKRRIHKRPDGNEINACRPWLLAEVQLLTPRLIVCLGATAAQSILGYAVKIEESRGRPFHAADGTEVMVTFHPSAVLRVPSEPEREEKFAELVADLKRCHSAFR